jgi:hypothetical protein
MTLGSGTSIGDDALGLLEPPRREAVEHLSFIRKRSEDAVEGADAIGDHDVALPVCDVAVADLALVLVPE